MEIETDSLISGLKDAKEVIIVPKLWWMAVAQAQRAVDDFKKTSFEWNKCSVLQFILLLVNSWSYECSFGRSRCTI